MNWPSAWRGRPGRGREQALSPPKIKAVSLMSGGLDSTLSALLVKREGVEVLGINFQTGFCIVDHKRWMGKKRRDGRPYTLDSLRAGAMIGVPVEVVDIREDYMRIVTNPVFGYGKAVNPCIDCRIFMFRKGKRYMEEQGANFLVSGEVLGQRPMTQTRRTLMLIDRVSGVEGLVLRPLSAGLLPETLAARKGWVRTESLLSIRGRSRKVQMELAAELGLKDYPQPAGGCCFLTDFNYGKRMKDLFKYRGREGVRMEDILSLKVGRHFRLPGGAKLILPRDGEEENFLLRNTGGGILAEVVSGRGNGGFLPDLAAEEDLETASRIILRYAKLETKMGRVRFSRGGEVIYETEAEPLPRLKVLDYIIT